MRRLQPLGVLILIPAVCLLFTAPGCGKNDEKPPAKAANNQGAKNKDTGSGSGSKGGDLTELASTGWGTLTGTVTYEGTPPKEKKINMADNKNAAACHEGAKESEVVEQTWLVNPKNKGVANVAVWLKPPEGKYFKIHESYLNKKKNFVELRQPHCAFVPHVLVYWASYYDKDTKDQKPSGQAIKVINDAAFSHNTKWSVNEDYNQAGSATLDKGKEAEIKFAAQDTPISMICNIHPWMNAKCWSLDTPYAARTDEDGKFKIENVPTGAELQIVAWHEGPGFFWEGGKAGKTMKLEDKNDLKITLKK